MTENRLMGLTTLSVLLVFLTGCTALVFQNTWHQYLTYLLGSQSESAALIISVFLGGMSLGYFLYGRLSQRFRANLFKLYGATEFFIGIWALFSPKIYKALLGVPLSGFMGEFGITLVFLGIPTVLMGATIPILTQALSLHIKTATRVHSLIYGVNTLGAAVGSILAGFYLLPNLGLPLSLMYCGGVNMLVGLWFYLSSPGWVRRYFAGSAPEHSPAQGGAKPGASWNWLWSIAFLSGFITIGLEIIMIRLMGLAAGSSSYSFSLIVGIFLLCIAFGGALVGQIKNIPRWGLLFLLIAAGGSLLILYRSVETWPYHVHIIRTYFTSNHETFPVYFAALSAAVALVLIVPISLCGATLPLCFDYLKRNQKDLGRESGSLYAINTLGCVLGALLPGYFLLRWFNLNEIFLFIIFLNGLAVLIVLAKLMRELPRRAAAVFVGASGALLIAMLVQPLWDNNYFAEGLFRLREKVSQSFQGHQAFRRTKNYLYYDDGPVASVAVLPSGQEKPGLSILVNGKNEGNTEGDFFTMSLIGHLPVLFAEHPEKTCVIGFGTGMTAGVMAQYSEVKEVDLIEINSKILEAGKMFSDYNYQALDNPKVTPHRTDAFRFFRQQGKRYDIIVNEPSNPWMAGVANLFTADFYEMVSENLAEDGIFSQWIHLYALNPNTLRMVLNTFRSTFPHYRFFYLGGDDVGLLGSKKPLSEKNLTEAQHRLLNRGQNRALQDLGFDDVAQLLELEIMSREAIDRFADQGGINSLENPKLGYMAGKDFFANQGTDITAIGVEDSDELNSGSNLLSMWRSLGADKNWVPIPRKLCERSLRVCQWLERRDKQASLIAKRPF